MSKQKRSGGTIENWYIEPLFYNGVHTKLYPEALVLGDEDGEYVFCVKGAIRGDSHWGNSPYLRTSLVVNITDEYVETLNTIYKLGKKREEL